MRLLEQAGALRAWLSFRLIPYRESATNPVAVRKTSARDVEATGGENRDWLIRESALRERVIC